MKVVDQGSGADLDPAGVKIRLLFVCIYLASLSRFKIIYVSAFSQDEMRRKQRPDNNKKKAIVLEAVLNTTCSKCNTRGHLAKDCFKVSHINFGLTSLINYPW